MRGTPRAAVAGVALLLILGSSTTLAEREPGPIAGACPTDDLVAGVTPADAQGTTFTGTYLGDAVGGIGDRHGMTVAWSVDRVYAGDGVPEDLVFSTPACAWTNLTPGVRYLFSTAVTDLERLSDGAGQPSVTDSLAWELRGGGAIKLAPFDTYDASDYVSAELAAITVFEEALAAVAPGASAGSDPLPRTDPGFGCTAGNPVAYFTLPDARGTTFVGRYLGDERLPGGPMVADTRVVWSVERVYAGGPLPEILSLRSDGCTPLTLKPGRRYLFSTADPLHPAAFDSVAWRLTKDDGVRLARYRSLPAPLTDWYRSEVRAIKTFDEALSAVAPDAGAGETPVRSGDRTPG